MLRRRLFGKVTAIEKPYSQAVVGDIYCSDNTIVAPANYSGSGKTAVGIVINNASGVMRVMLLNTVQWYYGGYGTDLPLTNIQTEQAAIADLDGVNNSNTMIVYVSGDTIAYSASFNYPNSYVPAIGELYMVMQNLATVNSSRVAVGLGAIGGNAVIVSSTEYDANYCWYLYVGASVFIDGQLGKDLSYPTYPFRKITY